MSEPSFFGDPSEEIAQKAAPSQGKRRGKRRRFRGCLPTLVVLALLAAGGWWAYGYVSDQARGWFAGPEDYDGTSLGAEVYFEVAPGQSWPAMGQELEILGVVASREAFTAAARSAPDEQTRRLQPGVYELREGMKASDVVDVLVEPSNLIEETVTIPEGFTVEQILERLAATTDFGKGRYQRVLEDPESIGLPDYADGNPEGYLFPATYPIRPSATPETILTAMVDRWRQAADEHDLEAQATALGYTPHEVMTVAALIQSEAPPRYMPQVSRVIYNRVENPGSNAGTNGLLQLDATVNYAHGRNLGARTTAEQRQIDSPYNTYRYPGLPPGPIEAPGEDAIRAALEPASGDWYYYVTVNLATGETKFAETLSEHNRYVAELNEYCRTQSERC